MIRALVPVNLRPMEKAYKLGNQFGLVFLDLPIGIENPVERLYAVRGNMNALKGSYQPIAGDRPARGDGRRAAHAAGSAAQVLARNATAVMTNVPGPQQPLYLAGARIDRLMFWVPQSGNLGMGVSILSYDGEVQFGLVTDRGLCPDPGSGDRALRPRVREARADHADVRRGRAKAISIPVAARPWAPSAIAARAAPFELQPRRPQRFDAQCHS